MDAQPNRMHWSNADARAALAQYEQTVRAMARRLRPLARAGQALDEEDLRAEGRIAVLEALRSYQGFGIEERTWVRTRVRQRMIDAVRRVDVRSRDEVRLAVRHAAGDVAEGTERERGRMVAARRLVSIDATNERGEPVTPLLGDTQGTPADEATDNNRRRGRLLGMIPTLPERQRTAIELGLFEGLPLREIGDRMGISESRVCQLQKRAVERLHAALAA